MNKIRNLIKWYEEKINKFLQSIFQRNLLNGAMIGIVTISLVIIGYASSDLLLLGWGKAFDLIAGILLGCVFILIIGVVLYSALRVIKILPIIVLSLFVAVSYSITSLLRIPMASGIFLVMTIVLLSALFGATSALLKPSVFKAFSTVIKILVIILFSSSLIILFGMVYWIGWPGGTSEELTIVNKLYTQPINNIDEQDPSEKGIYKVDYLTYGSGIDRRDEYGKDVRLKTDMVDGKGLVSKPVGKLSFIYQNYWGYPDRMFPLNGRVWYPVGEGSFPLVLLVHGNHLMREYSDAGFAYLAELLASKGYVVASIDENFLNDDWSGKYVEEIIIRGYLVLEHLNLFDNWMNQDQNPLYKKIDFNNIALIGHSRGGEAIITAAFLNQLSRFPCNTNIKFNKKYSIKSLVALAPSHRLVNSELKPFELENVNFLLLHGSHDVDVSQFAGDRLFNKINFTNPEDYVKASFFIYRANHSQFNSLWGKRDWITPKGYLLNIAPLLSAEDQQQVTKVLISAFLDLSLKNEVRYLPVFNDYRFASKWLPKNLYITRYDNSDNIVICDFEEDLDVESATLGGAKIQTDGLAFWKEGDVGFVNSGLERMNRVVFLEWNNNTGSNIIYSIDFFDVGSNKILINDSSTLNFSIADRRSFSHKNGKEAWKPVNFTIKCVDQNGEIAELQLDSYSQILPPLKTKLFRFKPWEKKFHNSEEAVLQTVEIPMEDFVTQNIKFDPAKLQSIHFVFVQTVEGKIILDDIGIRTIS